MSIAAGSKLGRYTILGLIGQGGLAVVYRIMEQHGARVEVESEPGKGSAFHLRFDDTNVPRPGEPVVVVEAATETATREFDELRRSVRKE